jgi:hypothetical protein
LTVNGSLAMTAAAKYEGVQLVSVVMTCNDCGGEHLVYLGPVADLAYMKADAWHQIALDLIEADEVHKCRPRPAPITADVELQERTPY